METPFIPAKVLSVILKASSILKPAEGWKMTIVAQYFLGWLQPQGEIDDAAYRVLCTHWCRSEGKLGQDKKDLDNWKNAQ